MMNKAEKHTSKIMQGLLEESSPVEMQRTRMKMHIAAKIDDAIQSKEWTRNKLAKELGKNRSEITKWLSGTHNFTVDTLTEVCYVLGIDIASLFVRNENVKATPKRTHRYKKGSSRFEKSIVIPTDPTEILFSTIPSVSVMAVHSNSFYEVFSTPMRDKDGKSISEVMREVGLS